MLGFGRALGETMAVTMVIGNNPKISASLFAPQYTMAAVIANEFTEAADPLYLAALVEIGLVLFMITLDRELAVAPADLEHDAERRRRGRAERTGPGGRMRSTGLRKILSSLFVAFCAGSVIVALVPLGFVLFFVDQPGHPCREPRLLHAHAEAGGGAWRRHGATRSSAR